MATVSLQQSQCQLHARLAQAAIALAQHEAEKTVKLTLKRQGLKPQYIARREIVALANEYLAAHRAELLAQARPIIEQWRAEGFFGKRAALAAHNLRLGRASGRWPIVGPTRPRRTGD
jgi:hypothetical protein